MCKDLPETPTDQQIADACMWRQHDFGLCDDDEKQRRMFSMRENWRAIWKAVNTPGRGGQFVPPKST